MNFGITSCQIILLQLLLKSKVFEPESFSDIILLSLKEGEPGALRDVKQGSCNQSPATGQ